MTGPNSLKSGFTRPAQKHGGEGKIDIFAKNGDAYHNFMVDHSDGLRYPALEKITGEGVDQESGIDRLLQPKTR